MFTISYSKEKNRIYITIEGILNDIEFNIYKSKITSMIDISKPGFTVLADLSKCDSSVLENSDSFNVIREYGAQKGLKANAIVLNSENCRIYSSKLQGGKKNVFLDVEEAENYLSII